MSSKIALAGVSHSRALFALEWFESVVNVHVLIKMVLGCKSLEGHTDVTFEILVFFLGVKSQIVNFLISSPHIFSTLSAKVLVMKLLVLFQLAQGAPYFTTL